MKTNWYSIVSQLQVLQGDPKPMEYVFGWTFFCGEWFKVTSGVLIPRAETETIVDYVTKKTYDAKKILDLGTGSGNIAVMLAKKLDCHVCAADISKAALDIAVFNAKYHGVYDKIEFRVSDWYDGLNIERVDIIVSNPPYISDTEWPDLPEEVRLYEPETALRGGHDGLDHYRKIIEGAHKFLKPEGVLVLEIGYKQRESVKQIFLNEGFRDIEIIKDQFDNDRIISGIK